MAVAVAMIVAEVVTVPVVEVASDAASVDMIFATVWWLKLDAGTLPRPAESQSVVLLCEFCHFHHSLQWTDDQSSAFVVVAVAAVEET